MCSINTFSLLINHRNLHNKQRHYLWYPLKKNSSCLRSLRVLRMEKRETTVHNYQIQSNKGCSQIYYLSAGNYFQIFPPLPMRELYTRAHDTWLTQPPWKQSILPWPCDLLGQWNMTWHTPSRSRGLNVIDWSTLLLSLVAVRMVHAKWGLLVHVSSKMKRQMNSQQPTHNCHILCDYLKNVSDSKL